ncbi:N-methyl-L-tryptophan oxidase [Lentibacillus cibarius]|uniref:N-methyl-L-tryptophan oxidase n=1 Tax=Lentibacillus cibarius TaxID=2583219 RepID=A0A5S3QIJ5_9BACI|nr:N-methyl-L-tryptophan oxidase [Lentibacillus cibarius]TMN21648.1 N-methyl-L-tryptophan oxidase [Lentibacillus cibarius]
MNKNYSVIIIGAGSVGMAAGYYLSKKGVDTLLIDAFDPPHRKGSHHGETRMIRHGSHISSKGGQHFVPLVQRAQELWLQLEKESEDRLFIPTGNLTVSEADSSFMKGIVEEGKKYSPLEILNADEIKKNWPGFTIPEHFKGCFEPLSGVLLNEKCVYAYKELRIKNKAALLTNTNVKSIDFFNQGVTVNTEEGSYHADKVLVCAGAWTGKILSSLDLPLNPVRKTFAWFEADDLSLQYPQLPSFYFHVENQIYYGFPNINGSGVKLGRSDSEKRIEPDFMRQDFGKYASDEGDLRNFLDRFLPQASGKLKKGKACLATNAPDKQFIVDQHPEYPHVYISGGYSGRGFQISSVLGEILSQLITEGSTTHDISAFSLLDRRLG